MKNKYYLVFTDEDKHAIIACLIEMRNNLIQQGKCTDSIDELLIKFSKCKTKKFKVIMEV